MASVPGPGQPVLGQLQDTRLSQEGNQTLGRGLRKDNGGMAPLPGEKTLACPRIERRPVDIGFCPKESGIVHEILCRKVVRTINDDIIVGISQGRFGPSSFRISDTLTIRINPV